MAVPTNDYCLKWNDHHSVFFSRAEELCGSNMLCDVSLSAGDKIFQAHKLVLSVCSPYFQKVFAISDRTSNTVIYMKNVDPRHLELILAYMYRGELTLKQTELVQFLATAKDLQIRGLSDMVDYDSLAMKDTIDIKPEISSPGNLPSNLTNKRKAENLNSHDNTKPTKHVKPLYTSTSSPSTDISNQASAGYKYNYPGSPGKRLPPNLPLLLDAAAHVAASPHHGEDGIRFKPEEDIAAALTSGDKPPIPGLRTILDRPTDQGAEVGAGQLRIREHLVPEEDDNLSNLSAGDVQNVEYDDNRIHDGHDNSKQDQSSNGTNPGLTTTAPKSKRSNSNPTTGTNSFKPFPCGMCDMSFDQNWLLKRHYRTHTKERPFRCLLCQKNFSLKDSCIRHIRNVHRGELYGEATVSDISASYCQFDVAGGGANPSDQREDLDADMTSNEALAVAI